MLYQKIAGYTYLCTYCASRRYNMTCTAAHMYFEIQNLLVLLFFSVSLESSFNYSKRNENSIRRYEKLPVE